jgi:mannose-6-phosphate isomerase-like protein (cupin superfamily)
MPDVVNLRQAFTRVSEPWSPRIIADVNDTQVKLARLRGEFVWHHHEREDELFLVVEGRLRMQFRDGDRDLGPGELLVVPRGVEHCPLALTDEVQVLLLEPRTTLNTGNVVDHRTVHAPPRL